MFEKEIEEYIDKTMTEIVNETQQNAKRKVPVESGTLKDDIQSEHSNNNYSVFNTVDYAPFVHQGTSIQAAQPYLRNAAIETIQNI